MSYVVVLRVNIYYLIFLSGIFAWLVYAGYRKIRAQVFLSLNSHDEEGDCDGVPLEVSGSFLADDQGNWEGDKDFVYSKAIYFFTFNRLVSSESTYAAVIDSALNRLDTINEIMQANNLATTILFWTTWTYISSAREVNTTAPDLEDSLLADERSHYFGLTGICIFLSDEV